jgi:hypothetical protein
MATGLKVEMETYHINCGGYDADDPWSRDSSDQDNTFIGVSPIVNPGTLVSGIKNGYLPDPDVVIGADVKVGDTVYVVWYEYTTGDSFGSDSGKFEFVAAYTTEELAEKCKQKILDHDGGFSMTITLEDGEEFSMHCPWVGYFERLEGVHINKAIIT